MTINKNKIHEQLFVDIKAMKCAMKCDLCVLRTNVYLEEKKYFGKILWNFMCYAS